MTTFHLLDRAIQQDRPSSTDSWHLQPTKGGSGTWGLCLSREWQAMGLSPDSQRSQLGAFLVLGPA